MTKIYSTKILTRKHGYAYQISYQGGDVTMTHSSPTMHSKEMAKARMAEHAEVIEALTLTN